MENTELTIVTALHAELDKKFAQNLIILELNALSPIADYFVIATGGSAPQLAALAQAAEELLKSHGMNLHHTEGLQSGKWVLLDFGTIIVHLFDKESREYYNLERIWADAKVVKV
ncbi:MAG: ribosome silencing factor [Defluviitaleaceae bacterium]|nr:ribosome silencing factor [Defluviitaleaceae bacterium]MCL2263433.1 ribosome silencing factor [Defluviitaleaceae bacterium]